MYALTYGKCALQGTSCVDQTCATAGTLTSNLLCNGYIDGCVVNNTLDGCMDLPSTCAARKQQANCEFEQNSPSLDDKCQWDNLTNAAIPVCIDIKCENAHLVTLKSRGVTQSGCQSYYSLKCILIKTSGTSTCLPRPKSCTGLVQDACQYAGVLVGDKNCYWDLGSSSCKDVSCSSITFLSGVTINHSACQTQNPTGTVNLESSPTGCISLKPCNQYTFAEQCKKYDACSSYVNSEQCKQSDQGIICFWVTNQPSNPYCSEKLCSTGNSRKHSVDFDHVKVFFKPQNHINRVLINIISALKKISEN